VHVLAGCLTGMVQWLCMVLISVTKLHRWCLMLNYLSLRNMCTGYCLISTIMSLQSKSLHHLKSLLLARDTASYKRPYLSDSVSVYYFVCVHVCLSAAQRSVCNPAFLMQCHCKLWLGLICLCLASLAEVELTIVSSLPHLFFVCGFLGRVCWIV